MAKNRRVQWRPLIVSPVNTGTNFNCCPSESFFLAPGGGLIVKKATRCITRIATIETAVRIFPFSFFSFYMELFSSGQIRFLVVSNRAEPLIRCAFIITWPDLFSLVRHPFRVVLVRGKRAFERAAIARSSLFMLWSWNFNCITIGFLLETIREIRWMRDCDPNEGNCKEKWPFFI